MSLDQTKYFEAMLKSVHTYYDQLGVNRDDIINAAHKELLQEFDIADETYIGRLFARVNEVIEAGKNPSVITSSSPASETTVKKSILKEWAASNRDQIAGKEATFGYPEAMLKDLGEAIVKTTKLAESWDATQKVEVYADAIASVEGKLKEAYTENAGYERMNTFLYLNGLTIPQKAALIALAREESGEVILMEEARIELRGAKPSRTSSSPRQATQAADAPAQVYG